MLYYITVYYVIGAFQGARYVEIWGSYMMRADRISRSNNDRNNDNTTATTTTKHTTTTTTTANNKIIITINHKNQ